MTFDSSRFVPHPKPPKREKRPRIALKRSPIKYVKVPTGEKEVFRGIWNSRPHKSEINGEPIYQARAGNFIHVIPKGQGKFPKFKLYAKNIILGTEAQHHLYDNGSHEELRKLPEWKWVFELRDKLIEEYKQKFGKK